MHRICFLSMMIALAATFGCGGGEAPPESGVAITGEHGAGTVLKADAELDNIVPPDYQIEKLAEGFIFTEGPLWIRNGGFLLFSDVRGNAILRWSPQDGASDFIKPVFEGDREGGIGPNGLTLDSKGTLMICEHGNRRISRLRLPQEGERTVVVANFEGKKLNSPNDLVYKSDGWLYFTDPPYGLAQQDEDPTKELDFNGVFRLSPDEQTLEAVVRDMTRPNGIGFSPDEKTLYVANSDPQRKLWMAYDINDDGTVTNGRVFYDVTSETAEGLPDGLKLDKRGNLYCTGPGGVWIFAPDGKHLGTIQPEQVPANVAWGDDGKSLYMTARTGLYRIRLSAEGAIP
ncbi:MAG: SMP-30/gluconolactonase/LRE family protein [Bryobacterales bacterium]